MKRNSKGLTGILPHVHGGAWDEREYLRYFAGRMVGNVWIDELALWFFFSLMDKPTVDHVGEEINRLLLSHGFEADQRATQSRQDLGSALEEIQLSDIHVSCGRILKEALAPPSKFPAPAASEKKLVELFDLGEVERRLLCFYLACSVHSEFTDYCRNIPLRDQYGFIALATGAAMHEFEGILRPDSPLMKNGILELERGRRNRGPLDVELNEDILLAVTSPKGRLTSLPDHYLKEGPVFPLDSFPVEAELTDIALRLAGGAEPGALLFYGAPGTGKTEFARSIAEAIGKKARFFRSEDSRPFNTKRFRLRYLNRVMDPRQDILVVDEAEEFLQTRGDFMLFFGEMESSGNKSFINLFLEDFRGVIIFIVNSTLGMDASLKRRFHLSLRFPENGLLRRLDFWRESLERRGLQPLFTEKELRSFAVDFPVSAAAIAGALDTATAATADTTASTASLSSEACSGDPVGENEREYGGADRSGGDTRLGFEGRELKQVLRTLLSNRLELQTGLPAAPKMEADEYETSEDILCTDTPLDELFRAVSNHRPGRPLSVLFSGPPGTGKTTLAERIAERQGRELRTVRASDILAPFVGQNEQNIRRVFSSTDPKESILLIDEADSLFYNRSATRSEWRQSMTNELLSAMESYPGILICATNLIEHLDAALMRRFAFKVKFRPLRPEQRLEAIRLHFPEFTSLVPSDGQRRHLAALTDLTPGDIAAVRRRLRLAEEKSSFERVLDELKSECSYKSDGNATIGFI